MNEIMNSCVWRQRREDMMREAERRRLARFLRADRKGSDKYTFLVMWELKRIVGLSLKLLRRLEGSGDGVRP